MSQISQFSINKRSDYSNQFTIAIKMIKKGCNWEINKIDKKVVNTLRRKNKIEEKLGEAKRK